MPTPDLEADTPMVSCLMVTQGVPERFPFLRRSIAHYAAQTHRHRELVIILADGLADQRAAVTAYVRTLGRDDIRLIEAADDLGMGALRNLSREAARGAVLCQWDDDDLHHPRRLERQLAALTSSGARAVYLQELMHYFSEARLLYCANWRATEASGHPGTLMCAADAPIRYPDAGEHARLGEDLVVARHLREKTIVHLLSGEPHLYVYTYHGSNAWHDGHHRMLVDRLALSQGLLKRRETELRRGLSGVDFGPAPVTLQGSNGVAFILEPTADRPS
jgi:glycosyltransferase involved in cell wall biosynthesis